MDSPFNGNLLKGDPLAHTKKKLMTTKMPANQPENPKGLSGIPSIPSVRPTSMRNLTPWKGNGK